MVTRRFSEGNSSLVVEGEKGARFPSPQKMLDDLLGTLTFDPLAFSRMDSKKQLETLRGMVDLDVDIDALDGENKKDFDTRTDVNRRVRSLEAQIAAIVVEPNLPDAPFDVSALLKELDTLGKHNSDVQILQTKVDGHRRDAKDYEQRANKIRQQIKNLEEEARKLDNLRDKEIKASEVVVPRVRDTKELSVKVSEATAINSQILARNSRDALIKQSNVLTHQAADLSIAMVERMKQRQEAIASAKMPVPGLSFGEGEILFNGLPFNQASDAEQLRVSVAIAMAANPKLRVLRIKDGSLLDDKSLALIASLADEEEFQVWIEQVDTTGKVGIFMEDGQVKAVNA